MARDMESFARMLVRTRIAAADVAACRADAQVRPRVLTVLIALLAFAGRRRFRVGQGAAAAAKCSQVPGTGVPYEDRDDFQRRSARQLDLSIPIPDRLELQGQGRAYMGSLVARARQQPGEDIPGTVAPLPKFGTRTRLRRCGLPFVPLHLRSESTRGGMVMVG